MTRTLIAFFSTGIVFVGLDFVWLTQMGPRLYTHYLAEILSAAPGVGPAALFYLIYIGGAVYFCVMPGLKVDRWSTVVQNAVVLALCAYATYDLTNQATLRIWSTWVTVFDLVWGVVATVAASSAGFFFTRWASKMIGGAMSEARSTI